MIKSNLCCILSSLTNSEFKELGKYIHSSFYRNSHYRITKIQTLYEQIKNHYPDYNEHKINWKKIFKKLYPDEDFDYMKLKKIIGEFLQISERYLAYLNFRRNKFT